VLARRLAVGNDDDVGVTAAAELHEALEDLTPAFLVLCPSRSE
jgi:hypothetical protein